MTNYSREMSLNAWVEMLHSIYGPVQNYGRSPAELFTRLIKAFGGGSRYLFRTQDPRMVREYLAKLFAWYCALGSRLEINVEEALWQKYPRACPRCLQRGCKCTGDPLPINSEALTILAIKNDSERPESLREWQTMFANLYRGPSGGVQIAPGRERIALIFARMAEELGELAEAIGQDRTVDADADLVIKNEIADVGAWIFALANNIHHVDVAVNSTMLADVAWELYPAHCHRCREKRCVCARGTFGLELADKGAMAPSHWDEQTGLANLKALRRYLASVASGYGPGSYTWSLIFIDLDEFGQINKTEGHPAGDTVLTEAASRMRAATGSKGTVFRRGGDEFVIVLEQAANAAIVVAEMVRRQLADTKIAISSSTESKQITVTASIGVATCLTDVQKPEDLEGLAEIRSREAKKAGRNCVVPKPSAELLARAAASSTSTE